MNHLNTITILLAFFFTIQLSAQPCTFDDPQKQTEYEILLDIATTRPSLVNALGPLWKQLKNGEICNLCNLPGSRVICNEDGYITSLGFSYLEYQTETQLESLSELPENIGELKYLERLYINRNDGLRELPESIGDLESLEEFQAMECVFSSLPESMGRLQKLKILKLNDGGLRVLSDSIGYLSQLEEIDASGNRLTILPESLEYLPALRRADFSRNRIYSVLPSLSELDSLEYFNLQYNRLGCLPIEIARHCSEDTSIISPFIVRNNRIGGIPGINFQTYCENPETYDCFYDSTHLFPCINNQNSTITYGNGRITFYSLSSSISKVEIINITNGLDETIVLCDNDCTGLETIENLPAGDYLMSVFSGNGTLVCETPFSEPIHLSAPTTNTGTADCQAVLFEGSDNQITISGLTAAYNQVEILGANTNWQNLTICDGDCTSTQVIEELGSGTYTVKVQQWGDDGQYCYTDATVEVSGEAGGTMDTSCDELQFSTGSGQITISGLTAADNKIEIIGANTGWQNQTICDGNCSETQVISNLAVGSYEVKVQQWDANDRYCYHAENVVLEALQSDDENTRLRQGIHLVTFQKEQQVQLQWVAPSDKTTAHYLVERANEDADYQVIALLPKSSTSSHTWLDTEPAEGQNQYRIREVFVNGSFRYSGVGRIDYDLDEQSVGLFPNPASRELYVNLRNLSSQEVTIQLYNIYGHLMKTYPRVAVEQGLHRLDLPDLENGLYWLSIKADNGRMRSQRFVVERGQ